MPGIDDAIAAKPHTLYNPLTVERDAYGESTPVAFERGTDGMNGGGPRPYVTCWVMRNEKYVYRRDTSGRAPHAHLDWARDLIAQALGVPVSKVALGFGRDQFDVRPF
jgi:hypothetical protein